MPGGDDAGLVPLNRGLAGGVLHNKGAGSSIVVDQHIPEYGDACGQALRSFWMRLSSGQCTLKELCIRVSTGHRAQGQVLKASGDRSFEAFMQALSRS